MRVVSSLSHHWPQIGGRNHLIAAATQQIQRVDWLVLFITRSGFIKARHVGSGGLLLAGTPEALVGPLYVQIGFRRKVIHLRCFIPVDPDANGTFGNNVDLLRPSQLLICKRH
jgi:hypothetical protein